MPLYHDYRPKSLKEIVGNRSTVASIESILKRKTDRPRAWLFTGPSGCGKTTLARIVAAKLGIDDRDLQELNIASTRGIDNAREIQTQMRLRPMGGEARGWILDECFARGTQISTPDGNKEIETIKPGDVVYSINGPAHIKCIFKNKVELSRVLKLILSDGRIIYTTKQHEFLTANGWKEAQYIKRNDLLLNFNCRIMQSNEQQLKEEDYEDMYELRKSVSRKETNSTNMLEALFSTSKEQSKQRRTIMQMVRQAIYSFALFIKNILQSVLCWKMEYVTPGMESYIQDYGSTLKLFKALETRSCKQSGTCETIVRQNEKEQSNKSSGSYCKNESDKTNKRNIAYMVRRTWRQWKNNSAATFIVCRYWMADRSCRFIRETKSRISDLLQSGYRQRRSKNSNRGGWSWAFIEASYTKRCEKDKSIKEARVESTEIYEQGNNDSAFASIIKDTDRNKGYVKFYDLEIIGHPSYFANGIAVHNCHMATKEFQNAMLKTLEDTPPHVFFFLCTTDPQKLLKTIATRCTTFTVESLSTKQIMDMLVDVVEAEKIDVPNKVLVQICEDSNGSARTALVTLDAIIDMEPDEMLEAAAKKMSEQNEAIDLCRALIRAEKWKKVAEILSKLNGADVENVRQAVMGYCNAILLKEDNVRAWIVLDAFKEPFDRSGRPGLTWAAYMATQAK